MSLIPVNSITIPSVVGEGQVKGMAAHSTKPTYEIFIEWKVAVRRAAS